MPVSFDDLIPQGQKSPQTMAAPSARGLVQSGNIDLAKRPVVKNADGSISTVRSMSFNEDGKEILVPTVSPDGRILSDDDAINLYHQSGQHLGVFDNPDDANSYAQTLHGQQDKMYSAKPSLSFDDLIPAAPQNQASPAAAPAAAEPARPAPFSGSILPVSRDAEGNVAFDSNAGIVGAVKRALTAPGRAMSGELQVMGQDGSTSPEAISEAGNFALTVGGISTPAAGTGKMIAANAPRPVRPGMEVAGAAQRIGVPIPRAVTSDAGTVQQAGKIVANVPFAGQPLRKAAQESVDALGNAATRTQEGFGSGSVATAGSAAREGINTYSKALSGRVSKAYDGVDPLITQNVVTPLSNTARIASEISAGRTNSRIAPSRAVALVQEALNTPEGLNYQGIKGLRTSIREMMDTPSLAPAETSQTELKRIYSALSDDLRASVSRAGGEKASQAFDSANQLAAKTAREQEGLQKVLGRDISDEALFDRVSAMAGSTSRADRISLARVKGAVGDDTWNEIASGVISKLGRAPDGNFSPDRFVTGWGKLSPEGKTQLFGGKKELASSLDDIATVSSRFKQLNQYANPSGTGQTVLGGAIGSGLIADPITTISSTIGARVLASVLAKPTSARAIAAYSKAYERQITSPSKVSQQAFINTSRAVAGILANEAGNKGLATQIFPVISTISRLPAEQGNENGGVQEQQGYGATQQLPVLLPTEI